MKKILLVCFFAVFASTFSKTEKIISVDYSYILDNYYKTKSFNKSLNILKNNLEKKYNISFNNKNNQIENSENKEKALEIYKNIKNKFIAEINQDIEVAIIFTGVAKNYDFILDKNAVLFGKQKDISKNILEFLNDVYFHEFTIRDSKRFSTDLIIS